MELTGTIKAINETQVFGGNGFRKRELVITTEEQYPQHILIEFVQDKCDLLDKFKEGQGVIIGINIRGREWINPQGEAKYFNSLQGWRIDAEGNRPVSEVNKYEAAASFDPADFEEETDDAPF